MVKFQDCANTDRIKALEEKIRVLEARMNEIERVVGGRESEIFVKPTRLLFRRRPVLGDGH